MTDTNIFSQYVFGKVSIDTFCPYFYGFIYPQVVSGLYICM